MHDCPNNSPLSVIMLPRFATCFHAYKMNIKLQQIKEQYHIKKIQGNMVNHCIPLMSLKKIKTNLN